MNSYGYKRVALVFGFLFLLVSACGKSDSPPAQPTTAPQPTITPAVAPAALKVSTIELGNTIGADKRVVQQATAFAPTDTIYVSVVTEGAAPNANLAARWTYEGGQVVNESTQTIVPRATAVTEFHISKPSGWPTGKYKVEVSLNGSLVSTKEFEVKG